MTSKQPDGRAPLLQARVSADIVEKFERLCHASLRHPADVIRGIVTALAAADDVNAFNQRIARMLDAAEPPPRAASTEEAARIALDHALEKAGVKPPAQQRRKKGAG